MKTPLNWENAPSPLPDTTAKLVFVPEDMVMGWLACPKAAIVAAQIEAKFKGMHNWQYDVDIKPEKPTRHGHPVTLSKATLSQIKDKLFFDNRMQFPLSMTAYDGEKNIFIAIPLPCRMYEVKIFSEEDSEDSSFQCTITLVNELKFHKLKDYLAGNLSSIPCDILQGMDLLMKENPTRHMISVGRHFYPLEYHEEDDLKSGVAAFRDSYTA
ncbi:hypothetical protein NL676_012115 [Syzygium grande]|nr:hypothetical protein NL676_012115 [Syzygium grande]